MKFETLFYSKPLRFGASVTSILLATVGLAFLGERVNLITVSLSLLLIVLMSATFFGRNPALLASFVAMLAFNYFFLPPVGTWHIAEPQNLVAWAAFTLTAIVAGELSAYASRRAREAERLYFDLQAAFETSMQAEALRLAPSLGPFRTAVDIAERC
jgi:two-component system sensor histidine kinase KdpD